MSANRRPEEKTSETPHELWDVNTGAPPAETGKARETTSYLCQLKTAIQQWRIRYWLWILNDHRGFFYHEAAQNPPYISRLATPLVLAILIGFVLGFWVGRPHPHNDDIAALLETRATPRPVGGAPASAPHSETGKAGETK